MGRWHPSIREPGNPRAPKFLFPGRQLNRVPRLRREKPWVEKPVHLAGKGAASAVTCCG